MLIRRLIVIVFIVLVGLCSAYFYSRYQQNNSQEYKINVEEIKTLLNFDGDLSANIVGPGTNPPASIMRLFEDSNKELVSVWFRKEDSRLTMDFYLADEYLSVLKEYPDDAQRAINHAIILGYINSQLESSKFNISTFCDDTCNASSFRTIEIKK